MSSVNSMLGICASVLATRLAWLVHTPLGRPVVPPVYTSASRSSPPRRASATGARAVAGFRGEIVVVFQYRPRIGVLTDDPETFAIRRLCVAWMKPYRSLFAQGLKSRFRTAALKLGEVAEIDV